MSTIEGGIKQAQNHDDKCGDNSYGCDLIWVSAANEHGELDARTGLWYEDDAHIISPPIGKLMSGGPRSSDG